MPRKLRVQYPGAIYHLMSRGDRREDVFLDDWDRHDFVKAGRRRCDPSKLAIAARIRKETTMTVKGIAALLHLGTPRNASVRLLEWAKDHAAQEKTTPAFGL